MSRIGCSRTLSFGFAVGALIAGCAPMESGDPRPDLEPKIAAAEAEDPRGSGWQPADGPLLPDQPAAGEAEDPPESVSDDTPPAASEPTSRGSSCATEDDCSANEICRADGTISFCEKGERSARGPLGQPPPPAGLLQAGRSDASGGKP